MYQFKRPADGNGFGLDDLARQLKEYLEGGASEWSVGGCNAATLSKAIKDAVKIIDNDEIKIDRRRRDTIADKIHTKFMPLLFELVILAKSKASNQDPSLTGLSDDWKVATATASGYHVNNIRPMVATALAKATAAEVGRQAYFLGLHTTFCNDIVAFAEHEVKVTQQELINASEAVHKASMMY